MIHKQNTEELKRLMVGRWPEAITDITGIGPEYQTGRNGPCPKERDGVDRWRVFNDFNETGGAICNQCGQGQTGGGMADGFAVIEWYLGCDFREAVRLVSEWLEPLGGPSSSKTKKKPTRSRRETPEFWTREEAIAQARRSASRSEKVEDVGEPVKVYEFGPNGDGHIELEVRFEFFEGGKRCKTTRPISRSGDKWRVKALDPPRPLYRLSVIRESSSDIVIICEGPKTTDAAVGLGYLATTSPGGSNNAENADWSPLAGRDVVILPDHDKPGKKYARHVAEELAKLTPPASVKIIELPSLQKSEDLVEWIERGGTREKLDKLIKDAPFWKPTEKPEDDSDKDKGRSKKDLTQAFPEEAADQVIQSQFTSGGIVTLRHWRDAPYLWTGCTWTELSRRDFEAKINSELYRRYSKITTRVFGDAKHNIITQTNLSDAIEPPSIIEGSNYSSLIETAAQEWDLRQAVFGLDGILYLPWLMDRPSECFVSASPHFFNRTSVACNVQPRNDIPKPIHWNSFLQSVWGDDSEAIEAFRLWTGYLLTADTSQQKILLIIGPKRSGKGTIARVLQAIHRGSVAGPTLASFCTNFGMSNLLDKSIAIVSDARLPKKDTAVVTERLLSISGEDFLMVDRKYKDPVNVRLGCRLMVMSNELPTLHDSSGALASRMIILPMNKSFYGQEDFGLETKLRSELDGIFWWCVGGWLKLRERGRLFMPQSGQALASEMEDLGSPTLAFVREYCEVGPGYTANKKMLYKSYCGWCDENGRGKPSDAVFHKNLKSAVPGLSERRERVNGGRIRVIHGLKLSLSSTADAFA